MLFQGSVGRTDLPGGDWADAARVDPHAGRLAPGGDRRLPGPHGDHDPRRASARPTRSSPSLPAWLGCQAPRGARSTCCPRRARGGWRSSACADDARVRRLRPGRDAGLRGHRAVRARRGGDDGHRREGDVHLRGPGRALGDACAPRAPRRVCRAYVEHGMHKLPQPVKLWYWGPFFRYEAPQAGRYRQFTQVGVEAIGSDDPSLDAEVILLLAELLERARRARRAAAHLEPRHARRRAAPTRTSCATTCARARTSCRTTCARGSTATRCAPSTRTTPAPAPWSRDAPQAPRPARATRTPSTSPRCARCSTPRGWPYEVDRHARARARLLHAHGVRVLERRARRAEPARRRRPLRRADRAARRAADARASAGRPASSGSCSPPDDARRRREPAARVRRRTRATGPREALPARARPRARGQSSAQMEQAGRSLKGQLKHADRLGAARVVIVGRRRARA